MISACTMDSRMRRCLSLNSGVVLGKNNLLCFHRLKESNGITEGLFSYKSREKSISSGNSMLAFPNNIYLSYKAMDLVKQKEVVFSI